jgi:hypothetical protein
MKIILKRFLVLGLLYLVAGGLAFAQDADVTFIMGNNRSNGWTVTEVIGADGVAELAVDNPILTLEVGQRYSFDFNDVNALFHPFDVRNQDNEILLDQGIGRGSLEQDEAIAFSATEDSVTFTLTPELAAVIHNYQCVNHELMVGLIVVTGM